MQSSYVFSAISRVELVNWEGRYTHASGVSMITVSKSGHNDWFLDKIILTDLSTNRSQDFFCYCWLMGESRSAQLKPGTCHKNYVVKR